MMLKNIAVIGGGLVGDVFVDYFIRKGNLVDQYVSKGNDQLYDFSKNDSNLIGEYISHKNQNGTSKKWGKVLCIPNKKILKEFRIDLDIEQVHEFINHYFICDKIYSSKSNDFEIHSTVRLKNPLKKANNLIVKTLSKINLLKNGFFRIERREYTQVIICTGSITIPVKNKFNQLELKKPDIIHDKLIKLKNKDVNSFLDGSKLNKNGDVISQDIPISVPTLGDKSLTRIAFYHMVLRSKLTSKNFIVFYFRNFFKCLKIFKNIFLHKRSFMYFSTYTLNDSYPVEINLKNKTILNSLKDDEPKMLAYHFDARIEKEINIKGVAYEHFTKDMKPIYCNPVGLRMLRILTQIN